MAILKSLTINQTSDSDNYILLNDNSRSGANKPATTTNKLYSNSSGLFWEDYKISTQDFLNLTDTPSDYSSQAGKGVRVNSGATALEFYDIGSTNINDLSGTPSSGFTGAAGNFARVNDAGNEIEYTSVLKGTSTAITVTGDLNVTGDVTSEYSASDIQLKSVVGKITNGLDAVRDFTPIKYNWNEKAKELFDYDTEKVEYGLIAQDVQKHYPELVKEKRNTEYLSLNYERIIPVLVSAIKQLDEEVTSLKKQLEELK